MGPAPKGKKNQNTGRSRGGLTSKVHTLCDGAGNPLKFIVTAGHRNDAPQARALLEGASGRYVLADRGYDANHIVDAIESMGAEAVVPPRSNRKVQREYDTERYKERNVIERLFNKMKHFRHFSTRYDKQSIHFESFVYLISICLWLK